MKTITGNTEAEIVEKRSKFISNLYYVETVEQAENKLKEIKKRYNDARHNCFAYRVCEKNTIVERASDDGEPSGTAGAPICCESGYTISPSGNNSLIGLSFDNSLPSKGCTPPLNVHLPMTHYSL